MRPFIAYPEHASHRRLLFNMQTKLVLLFLFITLVPISLLSYIILRSSRETIERSTNQLLLISASQVASEVDSFLSSSADAVGEDARSGEFLAILSSSSQVLSGGLEELAAANSLETRFRKQALGDPHIRSYILLNSNGEAILSTSNRETTFRLSHLGLKDAAPNEYDAKFAGGRVYISPLLFSGDGESANLYFAAPVKDGDEQVFGVLVAEYDGQVLQSLIEKYNGQAGEGSYAVIFDENRMRLAHGGNSNLAYKLSAPPTDSKIQYLRSVRRLPSLPVKDTLVKNSSLIEGFTSLNFTEPFFTVPAEIGENELHSGAAVQIENQSWVAAFLQPQGLLLIPAYEQARSVLVLFFISLSVSTVLALVTARRLTLPVERLTRAAKQITEGDLWAKAPEGRDEIGFLGRSLNSMTTELRQRLEDLEHQMAERTAELAKISKQAQRRSKQLETVSEVARIIASIQDPESLLCRMVQLINERFGYYHVGIFLVDKQNQYAVLRAANSEGGQRMLLRGHRLKVSAGGLVGLVISSGEPRTALDVGADAVIFDNPDLPYTRSELAIPLKSGSRVIGAVDVQAMEQEAFSEDNIKILRILADQLATAIENVRLLHEVKDALFELDASHRQHLGRAWTEESVQLGKTGYLYNYGELIPLQGNHFSDLWDVHSDKSEPFIFGDTGSAERDIGQSGLAAPINIRGEVIGLLKLEAAEECREWSEEDLALVKSVADQVGLAMENARLIDQTQRRAEREHLVAEITTKMRASNDPQVILETAVSELRQVLRARAARVVAIPSCPSTQGIVQPSLENEGEVRSSIEGEQTHLTKGSV